MAGALTKYALINAKLRARDQRSSRTRSLDNWPSRRRSMRAGSCRRHPAAHLEEVYGSTGDLRLAEIELLKGEIELYRSIHQYLHESSRHLVDRC